MSAIDEPRLPNITLLPKSGLEGRGRIRSTVVARCVLGVYQYPIELRAPEGNDVSAARDDGFLNIPADEETSSPSAGE